MTLTYFKKVLNDLEHPKAYLFMGNFLLAIFLIIFSNLHLLPLKHVGDFAFIAAVAFALALYRPGWMFLIFTGTIMLENINLAPESLGLMIRPFQFFGALTILAVVIRVGTKRLGFSLPRFKWYDSLPLVFVSAGFASAFFAGAERTSSFKLAFIAGTFAALYYLVRVFIQDAADLKKVVPFFLSSSLIVVLYGIWQNVRYLRDANSFEVMPGRPNGTFTEADWYGIFITLLLAVIYSLIYYFSKDGPISQDAQIPNSKFQISNKIQNPNDKSLKVFLFVLLIFTYISLILTVSRSAWLGALVVTLVFLFTIFTQLKISPKNWQWRKTLVIKIPILLSLVLSFFLVYFFHLTNFQLFNRAQSTASGLQKITISCSQKITLPEKIDSTTELAQYGCRHVNLEEIQSEEGKGNFVSEIFRIDPNVGIRGQIYQKSWQEIKNHPVLGIGWGNIGKVLGTDENGHALNSSNIFLEVWLGSGLIGLVAFALMWIVAIISAVRKFFFEEGREKTFGIFLLLGIFSFLIPNLFNAGVMLGILWLFFGVVNFQDEK